MLLNKPLLRACLLPAALVVAALTTGVLTGLTFDNAGHATVVYAAAREKESPEGLFVAKARREAPPKAAGSLPAQPISVPAFQLAGAVGQNESLASAQEPKSPEPQKSPRPFSSPASKQTDGDSANRSEEAPAKSSATSVPSSEKPKDGNDKKDDKQASTSQAAKNEASKRKADVSIFDNNTLLTAYGTPLAPGLGVLGKYEPEELVRRMKVQARAYDKLNGDRGVVLVAELIYSIVQAEQTKNGLYLSYTSDAIVERYLALAEKHDMQLVLDLQIGRGDVVEEVKKIDRFLRHPRVHVAVDPEYAVGPEGIPIRTPGRISGHEINAIQKYLDGLVTKHDLPRKMFIIHQFMDSTITHGEVTKKYGTVDLVLNMDAFGDYPEKVKKYKQYASLPYAQKRSFNIFLKQDRPVASVEDMMRLDPFPDMVMYQ